MCELMHVCVCESVCVPGGQQLCILQIQNHIQEVVTPEDPSLQQQETETDTIPDDAGLVARQLTLFTVLLLRCRKLQVQNQRDCKDRQTDGQRKR